MPVSSAVEHPTGPPLDPEVWFQLIEFLVKESPGLAALAPRAVLCLATQADALLWPDLKAPCEPQLAAAQLALRSARSVETAGDGRECTLALPLAKDGRVFGAIAFLLRLESVGASHQDRRVPPEVRALLDLGCAWLARTLATAQPTDDKDSNDVLPILETFHHSQDLHEQLHALANKLARDFDCSRLALILLSRRQRATRVAFSGDQHYPSRSPLVHRFKHALKTALAADTAGAMSTAGVMSSVDGLQVITLGDGPRIDAAIILERDAGVPLTPVQASRLTSIANALGPTLALARRAARDPHARIAAALSRCTAWTGASAVRTVMTAVSALAVGIFSLMPATWQVSAIATIEGEQQRVIVAPMDTYIDAVHVAAGDDISAGMPLVEFSTDDLVLAQVKWASERARAVSARRDAAARQDRTKLRVLEAQIEHANAELELVRGQIARRALTAPIDGVVVSGDLAQRLGAPVKRGETLFEIVPREAFRVALLIDEREVNDVHAGQRGSVKLSAFPTRRFDFVLDRVTPLSEVNADGNHFLAYARIEPGELDLRPGMAGVARVDAGQRARLATWTSSARRWFALQWWRWFG